MTSEAQFVDATFAEGLLDDGEDSVPAADLALAHRRRIVIAFVGMAFEAKIAAGPGVLVFSRNSRRELAMAAKNAARLGYRGIISFGVAGGLASNLRPGDWVVASAIVESDTTRATDAAWSGRLRDAIKGCSYAPIVGADTPIAEPATKRVLHRTTGAAAVDMESHVVARVAAAHGLSFTALRVIVDPADRAIPRAALVGMGSGPRADSAAVLRELIARPSQLPQLVRISLDAFIARSQMQRVRRLLGPHFGLGEPGLAASTQSGLTQDDLVQADVVPYRSPA
jgi:adenosylhomocysteine nucleosidase